MDNELWNGQVRINKDILKYSDHVFLGLSMKQTIFGALSILVAIGLFFVCYSLLGLPRELALIICAMAATPLAAFGFLSYNGMSFAQLLVAMTQHFKTKAYLSFKSKSYFMQIHLRKQKDLKKKRREKKNAKNI